MKIKEMQQRMKMKFKKTLPIFRWYGRYDLAGITVFITEKNMHVDEIIFRMGKDTT